MGSEYFPDIESLFALSSSIFFLCVCSTLGRPKKAEQSWNVRGNAAYMYEAFHKRRHKQKLAETDITVSR